MEEERKRKEQEEEGPGGGMSEEPLVSYTSDNALVCSIVSSSYFNDNSTIFAKWKKILLTQSS